MHIVKSKMPSQPGDHADFEAAFEAYKRRQDEHNRGVKKEHNKPKYQTESKEVAVAVAAGP
jgi:hypothetical protein